MIRIAITSDIHIFSEHLYNHGAAFEVLCQREKGKLTKDGRMLFERILNDVICENMDVLLITGDLTYNGELESHKEVIEHLKKVKDRGIRVFVLPGNHDIGRNARSYVDDEIRSVATVMDYEFAKLYQDYGYGDAISRDKESLSYVAELANDLWLVCLDNCCRINQIPEKYGVIYPGTFAWLEAQFAEAKKRNISCVVAGHYNLTDHNEMFRTGFTMSNKDEVAELFEKYGIRYFLSGHMHMQHRQSVGNVIEIATAPPTTWPHRYAVLTVEPGQYAQYQTKEIPMSRVRRMEYCSFYRNQSASQVIRELAPIVDLTDDEITEMVAFATRMHVRYFGGYMASIYDEIVKSDLWKLWETKAAHTFFFHYMQSMLEDNMEDHNNVRIEYDQKR